MTERETRQDHNLKINGATPACMGTDTMPGVMQWVDPAVKPEHGDQVLIWTKDASGAVECIQKRLFLIDGEWFAACWWFICPTAWMTTIVAVAPIVAEVSFEGWCPAHIQHQVWRAGSEEGERAWRAELNAYPVNQRAIARLAEAYGLN